MDFAQAIYGTASDVNKSEGAGLGQSIQEGAGLAMKAEQNQMQQQQLQIAKQNLLDTKVKNLYDMMNNVSKYSPAARNNALKAVTNYRDAVGLKDIISDNSIQSLKYDDNMGRSATLDSLVQSGKMTPAQAIAIKNDSNAFSQIAPTAPELASNDQNMFEAAKQANTIAAEQKKAEYIQGQEMARKKYEVATAGDVEASKTVAKSASDFVDNGGLAKMQLNIGKLQEVQQMMADGKLDTGTLINALTPGAALGVMNPDMKYAVNIVRSAQNLTAQVGGRVAVTEFNQLMENAFDKSLSKEQNAKLLGYGINNIIADVTNRVQNYTAHKQNIPGQDEWNAAFGNRGGLIVPKAAGTPPATQPPSQPATSPQGGKTAANAADAIAPPRRQVNLLSASEKKMIFDSLTDPAAMQHWTDEFDMSPTRLKASLKSR